MIRSLFFDAIQECSTLVYSRGVDTTMWKDDSIGRRFLMVWLCSAGLVTVVRFFNAVPMNLDLAFQIQVAHNLLAGKGFSIYNHYSPELTSPGTLSTLTIFPAGYSLYTAAILAAGGREDTAIRLFAAAATMLGWWGWGLAAYPFFGNKLSKTAFYKWSGFLIAALTPLLFTITWGATDIVLWAVVPWVLLWITKGANEDLPARARFDLVAGIVCGFAILMRYASVFVAAYALLLIMWQSGLRLRVLMQRWTVFALGLLPGVGIQAYINYFVSSAPARPGQLSFDYGFVAAIKRTLEGIPLLGAANSPWAFWLPQSAQQLLFPEVNGTVPWQLAITLGICIFLALTIRSYRINLSEAVKDFRVAAIGLFVAFPLLLLGCMTLGEYNYVGNTRYYWPLTPLSVFVVYSFLAVDHTRRTTGLKIIRSLAVIYLFGYVAMNVTRTALFFAPAEQGTTRRSQMIGTDLAPWPSRGIDHQYSAARTFVEALVRNEPDTVLLVSNKRAWFVGDSAFDPSRVHALSCSRASHLTGPAHIVFVTQNEGEPQDLWSSDPPPHAECFNALPSLYLLQRFPQEGIKVVESRVPAGVRIMLRP